MKTGERGSGGGGCHFRHSRGRFAAQADPDAVGQLDHGHFGVVGFGHGTADGEAAAAEAVRQRKTDHLQSHDEGERLCDCVTA